MDSITNQESVKQPATPQPIQQQTVQPESHSSSPKVLLMLLGFVIVLGLIGGAYYLGTKQKNNPSLISNKETKVSPTQVPTPTMNPTANWKTYTSSRFNFSVKYPTIWIALNLTPNNNTLQKIGDSEMADAVVPPDYPQDPSGVLYGGVFFQIFKVDPSQSLTDWAQTHGYQLSAQSRIPYQTTKVDGHEAVEANFVQTQELFDKAKQTSPLPVGYKSRDVYVKNNDLIIGLEASGNIKNPDKDLKLFDQMLSTFKFTQ